MTMLADRVSQLSADWPLPAKVISDFLAFLEEAPDEAVFRTNPIAYAEKQGLSEREAIDLFVHAARAGLVEMSWHFFCGGCGSVLKSDRALRGLENDAVCILCEVQMHATLDDRVEVAFTVSRGVRAIPYHDPDSLPIGPELERVIFSTNRRVHPEFEKLIRSSLREMAVLPGGTRLTSEFQATEGKIVMLLPAYHAGSHLEILGTPTAETQVVQVELREGAIIVTPSNARPGPVRLEIVNPLSERLVYMAVQKASHAPDLPEALRTRFAPFLTGRRLLTSQTFRDLFRAESIAPGGSFDLRNLTFLFTDLKGSTELYDRIGDLSAYRLVREHFKILEETVAQHEGAIVKTIGDAIMATFPSSRRALEAAILMHDRLETWNAEHGEDDLTLKIGIHEGPCIAVDSNDRLDYFGQTVNTAARIQGLAQAKETYFSDAVHAAPGVNEALEAHGFSLEAMSAALKGISERVGVYRMALIQ